MKKAKKNRLEFRFALFHFEAKITKVKRSEKFEAKRSKKNAKKCEKNAKKCKKKTKKSEKNEKKRKKPKNRLEVRFVFRFEAKIT